MVGEVFNEEDDENDSDEEDLQMKALEKRQASVAIVVDNEESPPNNNKLDTSDLSGGMVKVGNGSNYSDNHSMEGDFERHGSIISGGDHNAEADTDNMSSNMMNASIEEA